MCSTRTLSYSKSHVLSSKRQIGGRHQHNWKARTFNHTGRIVIQQDEMMQCRPESYTIASSTKFVTIQRQPQLLYSVNPPILKIHSYTAPSQCHNRDIVMAHWLAISWVKTQRLCLNQFTRMFATYMNTGHIHMRTKKFFDPWIKTTVARSPMRNWKNQ